MEKHYYEKHWHVRHILTNDYNFNYTGVGDNGEECFFKKGFLRDERLYVHPMFCSYSMDGPNPQQSWVNRAHDIHIKSNPNSQTSQEDTFRELLKYLDIHSSPRNYNIRVKKQRAQAQLETSMEVFEKQRISLIDMARNPNVSLEAKSFIPDMYEQVTHAMMEISNFKI